MTRSSPRTTLSPSALCAIALELGVISSCGSAGKPARNEGATTAHAPESSASESTESVARPTKLETISAGSMKVPSKYKDAPAASASPVASSTATPASMASTKAAATKSGIASPAPEAVCAHAFALLDAQLGGAGAAMPADQKKKAIADCVVEGTKDREANPTQYACESSCIMEAKVFDALDGCKKKCP